MFKSHLKLRYGRKKVVAMALNMPLFSCSNLWPLNILDHVVLYARHLSYRNNICLKKPCMKTCRIIMHVANCRAKCSVISDGFQRDMENVPNRQLQHIRLNLIRNRTLHYNCGLSTVWFLCWAKGVWPFSHFIIFISCLLYKISIHSYMA